MTPRSGLRDLYDGAGGGDAAPDLADGVSYYRLRTLLRRSLPRPRGSSWSLPCVLIWPQHRGREKHRPFRHGQGFADVRRSGTRGHRGPRAKARGIGATPGHDRQCPREGAPVRIRRAFNDYQRIDASYYPGGEKHEPKAFHLAFGPAAAAVHDMEVALDLGSSRKARARERLREWNAWPVGHAWGHCVSRPHLRLTIAGRVTNEWTRSNLRWRRRIKESRQTCPLEHSSPALRSMPPESYVRFGDCENASLPSRARTRTSGPSPCRWIRRRRPCTCAGGAGCPSSQAIKESPSLGDLRKAGQASLAHS